MIKITWLYKYKTFTFTFLAWYSIILLVLHYVSKRYPSYGDKIAKCIIFLYKMNYECQQHNLLNSPPLLVCICAFCPVQLGRIILWPPMDSLCTCCPRRTVFSTQNMLEFTKTWNIHWHTTSSRPPITPTSLKTNWLETAAQSHISGKTSHCTHSRNGGQHLTQMLIEYVDIFVNCELSV